MVNEWWINCGWMVDGLWVNRLLMVNEWVVDGEWIDGVWINFLSFSFFSYCIVCSTMYDVINVSLYVLCFTALLTVRLC